MDHRSREAFCDLFKYFAPRLKTYFLQNGVPAEAAEDVVQETMVQVWRSASSYDEARSSVSSWIFMMARSRQIDSLRRTRRPLIDPEDPVMRPPEPAGPEAVAEKRAVCLQLKHAISELPEEQQMVLRASYYQGLSHGEIARRFELPLGTVKSRLRLALVSMRHGLPDSV